MPAAALPYIGAGLGVYQTFRGEQQQTQALEEARKPRLSPEQQGRIRSEGTSNIQSQLAARGLGDSSLLTGGLANLEQGIADATADAGTMGNASQMLAQQAMGNSQGGAATLGGLAEAYMLQRLMGAGPNQSRGTNGTGMIGGNPQFPVWSGRRPQTEDTDFGIYG